jgi:hypothetical protein
VAMGRAKTDDNHPTPEVAKIIQTAMGK